MGCKTHTPGQAVLHFIKSERVKSRNCMVGAGGGSRRSSGRGMNTMKISCMKFSKYILKHHPIEVFLHKGMRIKTVQK